MYTMVQTPMGPTMIPVTAPWSGPGEKGDRESDNSKIQLPWFLYWDGSRRSDGSEMTVNDWERRLRGWASEFRSQRNLGNKTLNGLVDQEMWDEVEDQGTSDLAGDGGIDILVKRVRDVVESRGVHLQEGAWNSTGAPRLGSRERGCGSTRAR